MIIYDVVSQNNYTCQICKNGFSTPKSYQITINESPYCSNGCELKLITKTISDYDKNVFLNLQILLNMTFSCNLPKKSFIERVSKIYQKLCFIDDKKEVTHYSYAS